MIFFPGRVLLAVDLSNQLYKAAAANPTLASEGRYTGGLYGFIGAVQKAIGVCGATSVVLCRDMKPYKRSELYPEYKALRQGTKDPDLVDRVQKTLPLVLELAAVVGWPLWGIDGYESDDLIAYTMTQHRHRYERIVAMSNDSDLYQLFKWPQFSIYKGGSSGIYTQQDYQKEWNLDASLMPLVLAMTGTHNEVEGIRGIGPVTARKAVQDPSELRRIRQEHAAIIDRNIGLIRLPHPDFPHIGTIPKRTRRYVERDFLRFCGRYDINAAQSVCQKLSQITE